MKKFKLLSMVLLIGGMIVGCSSSKLSDVYDEEEVKTSGVGVIELLNEENYDGLEAKMSEKLKSAASIEELKKVWQPIKETVGEFEKIKKETVVGNEGLATIALMAKYKNGNVTFTITFNENLELEGLYMK